MKSLRDIHADLEAVLCAPEGRACVHGSDGDLRIIDDALADLKRAAAPQPAEAPRSEAETLRAALDSIVVYGTDTLSGRIDGPDDRNWQRAAVRVMRDRAHAALEAQPADVQTDLHAQIAAAKDAVATWPESTARVATAQIRAATVAQPAEAQPDEFANFHRLLCERFGYTHDPQDWRRDQLSLIEWIAAKVAQPAEAQPVAWIRGVRTPDSPDGPGEYDEELAPGDTPPPGKGWCPLYAAPVAQPQAQTREPLSEEQILDLFPFAERGSLWTSTDMLWLARAIERAHGIAAAEGAK